MAKSMSKRAGASDETNTTNPIVTADITSPSLDINKVLSESKTNLTEPKTRKPRATKAEMEQRRGRAGSSGAVNAETGGPNSGTNPEALNKQIANLKPVFKYGSVMIADAVEVSSVAFTDAEAEAMSAVSVGIMNAFPEYFKSDNPKVAAIISFTIIAGPICYGKYKLATKKRETQIVARNPEVKPEASKPQSGDDLLNEIASKGPFFEVQPQ